MNALRPASAPPPDFAHSTLGFTTAQHVAVGQHMVMPSAVTLAYFGKLPSRGDFVRSARQPVLMQQLDGWLARTMAAMSEDVRWKATFDAATPLHFVCLGPWQRAGLAGYLVPSQDAGGRRYPFMTTGSFDVADPARFLPMSPLALTKLWSRLATSARLAQAAPDLQDAQPQLHADAVVVDTAPDAHRADFERFVANTSVNRLDTLMRAQHRGDAIDAERADDASVRQTILALGLLLRPAVQHGFGRVDKTLSLPLPADPTQRSVVAAFWLALIRPFVMRHDVELAIFFAPRVQRPRMVVGFSGASATLLQSLLDPHPHHHPHRHPPHPSAPQEIDLSQAAWVESAVNETAAGSNGLRKLSTYLHDPQLSLKQVLATFGEAFEVTSSMV